MHCDFHEYKLQQQCTNMIKLNNKNNVPRVSWVNLIHFLVFVVGVSDYMIKICLCMIVKNECHIVIDTLRSLISHIHAWIVCDTGSTDGTQDVITKYFDDHGVPGELHQHKWVDFGHNRSLALAIAHRVAHKRYGCDFILMFDADDLLVGKPFFSLLDKTVYDGYSMKFKQECEYTRITLFNAVRSRWSYKGVLHEFPECHSTSIPKISFVDGEYHILSRRLGTRNKDPDKYKKDALTLEKVLETENDFAMRNRYLFYLAQSWRDAGDYQKAMLFYKKRIEMGGWTEEVYVSAVNVMNICITASCTQESEIRSAFEKAFVANPNRAECWHSMATSFRLRGDYYEAYAYATVGKRMPPPTIDMLFVDTSVYDFKLDDELSIAAYYIGKNDECRELCLKILKRNDLDSDTRQRIEQNLKWCYSNNL